MTERVLSERELNRALLARQLLLERAPVSIPRALERMGGLQAQYAPSMYIGLWSRVEGLQRDALTRALQRRSVVQGTLMRSTIHLVSAREYWPLALTVHRGRREWWLRANREGLTPRGMSTAARKLRPRLAGRTLRRTEIEELVGKRQAAGVGHWLAMVRVPPSGTWERRRADLYAAAEDWLGPPAAILPERHRERVFHTRMPQSVPTFLVDGAVAGAWRYDAGRVTFDPFERLDRATLREEGERMAAFHA